MTDTSFDPQTQDRQHSGQISYLLFRLNRSVYGVPVTATREIVLLPELKSAAEQAHYYLGVLNFRGTIVPVMDLEARLGRPSGTSSLSLDDRLLVLEHGGEQFGLVINQVLGVHRIAEEQLTENLATAAIDETEARFVDRLANVDDEIAILLNIGRLATTSAEFDTANTQLATSAASALSADMSAEVVEEFQQRARHLMEAVEDRQTLQLLPVAVVKIAEEYFGLEFEHVREFIEAVQVTPVPCCPRHVVGNVNLRGEILTVIDIRGELNLSSVRPGAGGKVVVVERDDLVVGLLVDNLVDAFYLAPADVANVPSAIQAGGDGYLKAVAAYNDTMMSIIDLPKLLAAEHLVVDDEVER